LEIRKASPIELTQVYANVHETWPHHPDLQTHVQLRLASAQHQKASWYIVALDDQIVASLGWYPFEFQIEGKVLPGAGIGAVHTLPQHRGRGYAKKLLTSVHNIMRHNGVKICHLYSDIDPAYYQQFGYLTIPTAHVIHNPRQEAKSSDLTLSEWHDATWQKRQQLFQEFGPKNTFSRSPSHWQWLDRRYPDVRHLEIQSRHGQPLGYLSFSAPYRSHPAQLMDGAWPPDWRWQQVFSLAEYGSWLLGLRDSFTAWYPQYFVADYPAAKLASQEIPMVLSLGEELTESFTDQLWFFPAEHV